MNVKNTNQPAVPQEPVANEDWAALLSAEDVKSLAGFFDVLIEMDFEAKRKEQRMKDEETTSEVSPSNQ